MDNLLNAHTSSRLFVLVVVAPPDARLVAPFGGAVYHTYSTYARGLDGLWGMYQWLDRAPKGRNETGVWWRHHDKYEKP